MNGRISVIVPVYNVERYVERCLESLVSQTYRNLEILVIDDGSTDQSGSLCDAYAAKDPRIRVFHQANGGAAAAKNTGLDRASGEYLAFVDSDDWVEPDAFAYMVGELEKSGADIVQCSFRDVYADRTVDHICRAAGRDMDQIAFLERFTEDWTCSLLWDKLYRRELFDGIRFETGHVVDDEYFTYQGVMNAKKVACRDRVVYNYRKRRSGAMGTPEHRMRIVSDRLDHLGKRLDRIEARYPQLSGAFRREFLFIMNWMSQDPCVTEKEIEQIQKTLRRRWRQCRFSGEDRGTDLALLRLKYTSPGGFLKKRRRVAEHSKPAGELFD
ncbi:MAG: glycosyltransferase [Lachnospiraceae bacterium]|nr:glycosyltransferase [Lachnospiraceae bacterium]